MLDIQEIIQASVTKLLKTRPDISRLDLSKRIEISDGALGRMKYGTGNPTADTLARLAKFFRFEAWQLLVPGFDPEHPPKLQTPDPVMASKKATASPDYAGMGLPMPPSSSPVWLEAYDQLPPAERQALDFVISRFITGSISSPSNDPILKKAMSGNTAGLSETLVEKKTDH